ncbi:retrovirus-related pol polyprotein from transposon TNT 1-94 [Tanacetum coccineum]
MMLEFDMSDLGKMRYFLGIEVIQSPNGIFVCQRKYACEVLARFDMGNSNPVLNPIVPGTRLVKDEHGTKVDVTLFKKMVGSLMYLTTTRPDLMYGVSLISRYVGCPTESHWRAGKRLLRYLKGTTELGIFYKRKSKASLEVYTDSDYAGDRRSTSGSAFLLGSAAVSWSWKKQPIVTLSTTESEYVAAASCACQCIWLRRILEELGHKEENTSVIWCDNMSTIQLSSNAVFHGRNYRAEQYAAEWDCIPEIRDYLVRNKKKRFDSFTPLSDTMLEKARNRILWAANIEIAPRPQIQSKSGDALKMCPHDSHVIAAIVKLFLHDRKIDKVRRWLNHAVTLTADIGDFWGLLYKFEHQYGTEDQQKEILTKCIVEEPKLICSHIKFINT